MIELGLLLSLLTAPAQAREVGKCHFQRCMEREHVEWFGQPTPNLEVTVGAVPTPGPTPGPTPAVQRTGKVHIDGWQAVDDQGPFNAVGFTFFSALRFYHNKESAQMDKDLDAAAGAGYHFARILAEVGWGDGKAIDSAWPDYDATLVGYIKHAYAKGIRSEVTIFGGSEWTMEVREARQNRKAFVQRIARLLAPIQEMVIYVEIINEPGIVRKILDADELAELARLVQAAMPGTIVIMGSPPRGEEAKYTAKGFPITMHLDRDKRPTPWLPERQPWVPSDFGKPWTNDEPIGPGSSVVEENDCHRLKALHMMTFIGKGFATVFHSGAGVYGIPRMGYTSGQVADMPCFKDIPLAVAMLPERLPQYTRKNGHWSDAPFRNLDPFDVGGDSGRGALRVYSGVSGDDFASIILNVPVGMKLECNTVRGEVAVYKLHPLELEDTVECASGVTFEVKGPGGKLIRRPLPLGAADAPARPRTGDP